MVTISRVGVLLLVVVALWLRIERLDELPVAVSSDESVDVVDAFHISTSGNYPLYEDHGRPEPLYVLLVSAASGLFGHTVWSARVVTALAGVLTIPLMYWAMRQCLWGRPTAVREAASLLAAVVIAVCISHVALSRAIYRGVLQPSFMLLCIGWLARGMRLGRRRDFVLAGVSLCGALYSYTAAYVLPLALPVVAVQVMVARRAMWQRWLGRFALMAATMGVLMLPLALFYVDRPAGVVGRANELNPGTTTFLGAGQLEALARQFFISGDINPQYNVAQVPLIDPLFQPLFALGLVALVLWARQPWAALTLLWLGLATIPVLAAFEIPHGLRIMGEFAIFPLVTGAGLALVMTAAGRLTHGRQTATVRRGAALVIGAALVLVTVQQTAAARAVYAGFWTSGGGKLWSVYGRELNSIEWFFRPDRQTLGRWLKAQTQPILMPRADLEQAVTRAWLLPAFATVVAADESFVLPADTQLFVPWALESGDLRREARHYVLLNEGTITLLPPFSEATREALLRDIDGAEAVTNTDGQLDLLGRTQALPDVAIRYEAQATAGDVPLAILGGETALLNWRGPQTWTGQTTLEYTLEWRAERRLGRLYSTFLQLQTQNGERLAGDDSLVLRWLHPSSMWQPGMMVPDTHRLEVPEGLEAGAYRLVTGMYPTVLLNRRLPALTANGEALGDAVTIGWLKVPQRQAAAAEATTVNATLGGVFDLMSADVQQGADGLVTVRLVWAAQVERPALDATVFVHVVDANNQIIAQQDSRPWGGQYPTFIWGAGEAVLTEARLDVQGAALGELRVLAGMYVLPETRPLEAVQDGETAADGRVVIYEGGGQP